MEGRIYQHLGFGDLGMRSKGTQDDRNPSSKRPTEVMEIKPSPGELRRPGKNH